MDPFTRALARNLQCHKYCAHLQPSAAHLEGLWFLDMTTRCLLSVLIKSSAFAGNPTTVCMYQLDLNEDAIRNFVSRFISPAINLLLLIVSCT
jgi:hypothetical protein